jgi:hypothetical protein
MSKKSLIELDMPVVVYFKSRRTVSFQYIHLNDNIIYYIWQMIEYFGGERQTRIKPGFMNDEGNGKLIDRRINFWSRICLRYCVNVEELSNKLHEI